MKKVGISKDKILNTAKEIAIKEGMDKINIREVAKQCNISVGSIYNYFPTKADLMIGVVEYFWQSTFQPQICAIYDKDSFLQVVDDLYNVMHTSLNKHQTFFISHSIAIGEKDKLKGRSVMQKYFEHIQKAFVHSIENDLSIKKDIWNNDFSKEEFASFVFSNILMSLTKNDNNCDYLKAIIKQILYI